MAVTALHVPQFAYFTSHNLELCFCSFLIHASCNLVGYLIHQGQFHSNPIPLVLIIVPNICTFDIMLVITNHLT